MPRPKSGPRMYRRPGRKTWYAFLSHEHKNISLGTEDADQARINLADLIHQRAAQGAAPKKGQLGTLFVEAARRAQVNHTHKYAYDLNLRWEFIAGWLESQGVTSPDRVTTTLVERFKADQRERILRGGVKGLSNCGINAYLRAWKKAMLQAVDDGTAPARVLTSFKTLREARSEPHQRGLTMDEIDAFLRAAEDERDFWLFRTVSGCGIRDDEARHLEGSSVRATAIVITPLPAGLCECHPRGWTTKNFRYRTIPASGDTVAAARSFVAVKHSMNLEAKSVWRRIQAARKAAGHNWEWSMHELRRAWGSHLLASGFKLSDVSRWYGHGDLKTTMRYLRVVEDEMPDPGLLPL